MPSGRVSTLTLTLTPDERAQLEQLVRAPRTYNAVARRARALLLIADGVPYLHAALIAGLSRRHVYKWCRRFQAEGPGALAHRPRGPQKRYAA